MAAVCASADLNRGCLAVEDNSSARKAEGGNACHDLLSNCVRLVVYAIALQVPGALFSASSHDILFLGLAGSK